MKWLLALVILLSGTANAAFTSARVLTQSLRPDCLDYCVIGICFWLRCGLTGCKIEKTLRIQHNNPDLLVNVYAQPGQPAWIEGAPFSMSAAAALQTASSLAAVPVGGGQSRTKHASPQDLGNLIFKEASVIGSPAIAGMQSIFGAQAIPFFCPSEARPMTPYFLSEADGLEWRFGLAESLYPASWIPGLREVGIWPAQTWGSVHPRQGFLVSPEEPKAAAVIAQRAADIVTRLVQPHFYVPVMSTGLTLPRHVSRPGPTHEKTDQWQMIYPAPSRCAPFGQDPTFSLGKQDQKGQYAFQLWRRYKCCTPNPGAKYLFSIQIPSAICPLLGGL